MAALVKPVHTLGGDMLVNQIKVLLQRVYNGGRKPQAILLSAPLRDMLRLECAHSIRAPYVQNTFPKDDLFNGVPVRVVKHADKILVLLKPE